MKEIVHSVFKSYLRNFPYDMGKQRVLSALWKPLSFGKYQRQTVLRQADVKMDCDVTRLIQRQLYFFGSYETENCAHWMKLAAGAKTIFDVGANVGVYSLLASKSNFQAAIHAFEPTPEVYKALTRNIRLNDMQNINVNQVGVGKTVGEAVLKSCGGDDNSNEGMNYLADIATQSSDMSIKVVTLDEYCRQNRIQSIDLMKMDIEGGEYDALLGVQKLLHDQAIGCIFMEMAEWAANRSGHSTIEIKSILHNAGYEIYQLAEGKLVKISDREDTYNGDVIAMPTKTHN